jgi:hypothetical protein
MQVTIVLPENLEPLQAELDPRLENSDDHQS